MAKRVPPPAELAKLLPGEVFHGNIHKKPRVKHQWVSNSWIIGQCYDGSWDAFVRVPDVIFYGTCDCAATLKEAISTARKAWKQHRVVVTTDLRGAAARLLKDAADHKRTIASYNKLKVP